MRWGGGSSSILEKHIYILAERIRHQGRRVRSKWGGAHDWERALIGLITTAPAGGSRSPPLLAAG